MVFQGALHSLNPIQRIGTQLVELRANGVRQHPQVAGVDADGAQLRPGDLHGQPDGFGDVVGVHEQGGALAE